MFLSNKTLQLILFASEYLKKEMDFNDDTKILDFNILNNNYSQARNQ